jgi:hypothetical protein
LLPFVLVACAGDEGTDIGAAGTGGEFPMGSGGIPPMGTGGVIGMSGGGGLPPGTGGGVMGTGGMQVVAPAECADPPMLGIDPTTAFEECPMCTGKPAHCVPKTLVM